tara:strand:- start:46 stop:1356 length:1311 start_codon:yes stop_codon:yes gene_type:complete
MAIIYTYPTVSASLTDLVLISDSSSTNPANQTKQTSITSIKDAMDVVDTLTAVLPLSATSSTGAVSISSRAYGGGSTTGHVPLGGTSGQYLDGTGAWVTENTGTVTGTGTVSKIPKWSTGGSGIEDSIITDLGTTVSVAGNFSTQGAEINKYLTDGAGSTGVDGYILSSTTVGADKEVAWIPNTGGSGPGTGTQYKLPFWSTTSTLGDSMFEQNSAGQLMTFSGTGGIAKLVFAAGGSSGAPAVSFINGTTGIFSELSGRLNLTLNGTQILALDPTAGAVWNQIVSINKTLTMPGDTTNGGRIKLGSPDNSNIITLEGPENSGTSHSLKMPNSIGTAGQALTLATVAGSVGSLAFGTLGVAAGGTGATSIGEYSVWVGTSNTAVTRSLSATGAIQLPKGGEGQRPATGVEGMIRYNTGLSKLEVYTGSGWEAITSV